MVTMTYRGLRGLARDALEALGVPWSGGDIAVMQTFLEDYLSSRFGFVFEEDPVLPEGLHIVSGAQPGTLAVVDAQEHVWVTLHDGAEGDPIEWRREITKRVREALVDTEEE